MVLRLAFVVLAMAGGTGVILYLLLWLISGDVVAEAEEQTDRSRASSPRQALAVGCVVGGILLLLRTAGVWFGDAVVWPVAVAAFGSAVIWTRGNEEERDRYRRMAARLPDSPADVLASNVSPLRIVLGGLLIAGGMATFLAANDAFAAARNVIFAVAVTVAGATLILGPWILRLGRQVADERRDRIRSEERGEMAAHLHDSVLQTLALIQRTSAPEEMVSLARGQERELRAWLYGKGAPGESDSLRVAIDAMAAKVEATHHVIVDAIVVGDCPVDERFLAVVQACTEATSNAARHSGAKMVSVFVEVEDDSVTAFVRDHGRGFAPDSVPADRGGIAQSIRGRIERHGGTTTITSAPGTGTEVQLSMPRVRTR